MITATILTLLKTFFSFLLSFLPTGSLPAGISNAIQYIVDSMYKFSDIIPVSGILAVVAAALTFELVIFGYKTIIWIFNKVRGISGAR